MVATEAMIDHPTCSLVSCSSSRTTAISGAMPNHAKKQRKNANHDMWNARICGMFRLKKLPQRDVALLLTCMAVLDSFALCFGPSGANQRRADPAAKAGHKFSGDVATVVGLLADIVCRARKLRTDSVRGA